MVSTDQYTHSWSTCITTDQYMWKILVLSQKKWHCTTTINWKIFKNCDWKKMISLPSNKDKNFRSNCMHFLLNCIFCLNNDILPLPSMGKFSFFFWKKIISLPSYKDRILESNCMHFLINCIFCLKNEYYPQLIFGLIFTIKFFH